MTPSQRLTSEKQTTVLVPGAAGSSAIGAIRCLKQAGFRGRIVATDGETLSAGFFMSDVFYVTHTITDADAFRQVSQLLAKENVHVIFPTSASETPVYASKSDELRARGILFVGSDERVVKMCDDKVAFYASVRGLFPVPQRVTIGDRGPSQYPCFVKPRFGSGSHGCGICYDVHDWIHFRRQSDEVFAQEVLPGVEYSVDVLCNLDGDPLVAVPRERLAIIDGVSVRAQVIADNEIQSLCLAMARHLQLKGPSCMQLKRDGKGNLSFLEVNPRLGGGAVVSSLAGVNIPKYLLSMALGEPFEIPMFREIKVIRHFDEIVVR